MKTQFEIRSADLATVLNRLDDRISEERAIDFLRIRHTAFSEFKTCVLVRHTFEGKLEAETARLDWVLEHMGTAKDRLMFSSKPPRMHIDELRQAPAPVVEQVWPEVL